MSRDPNRNPSISSQKSAERQSAAGDRRRAPVLCPSHAESPFAATIDLRCNYHGRQATYYSWENPGDDLGHIQLRRQADGMVTNLRRFATKLPNLNTTPFSTTGIEFDLTNRASALRHLGGGGLPIHASADLAFTRDAEGQILAIAHANDTAGYSYDSAGQVTDVTHSHPDYPNESYEYDLSGNRTGAHLWTGTATVETGNRLTSAGPWTFDHDAAGNVARRIDTQTGELTEFEYDHRNRLHRAVVRPSEGAAPKSVCEFDYDFLDRMIRRTIDGETTWVLYDRFAPIAEFRDGANAFSASFFYELDTAASPLGVWREGVGTRWFLKEDPIRWGGGDFNLYRYAANNPLSFQDPQGTLSAVEYATLATALARPATFCNFATCVAELWEGVTNAVITLAPPQSEPKNCGLKLLPGGPLIGDLQNYLEGKDDLPLGSLALAGRYAEGLRIRDPGLVFPGEAIGLAACAYQASN